MSYRQVWTVTLPNVDLPCPFPNSQLLCQPFSYHWCTCYTMYNFLDFFHSKLNSNRQEAQVARSTSDGGRRTTHSFPESSSDPNSVIRGVFGRSGLLIDRLLVGVAGVLHRGRLRYSTVIAVWSLLVLPAALKATGCLPSPIYLFL